MVGTNNGITYTNQNSNFVIPLLAASAICSTGFATNSETTVIGSMLISPIGFWIIQATKNNKDVSNIVLSGEFLLMLFVTILFGIVTAYLTTTKDTKVVEGRSTEFRKNNYNFIASAIVVLFASLLFAWADVNGNKVISTGIGIATALLPPLVATGFIIGKQLKKEKNETILQLNDSLYSLSLFAINLITLLLVSKLYFINTKQ